MDPKRESVIYMKTAMLLGACLLAASAQAETVNFYSSYGVSHTFNMSGGMELSASKNYSTVLNFEAFNPALGTLNYQDVWLTPRLFMSASVTRQGCGVFPYDCNAPNGGASLSTSSLGGTYITANTPWVTTCSTPSCSRTIDSTWNTYPATVHLLLLPDQVITQLALDLTLFARVSVEQFYPLVTDVQAQFDLRAAFDVYGKYSYTPNPPGSPSPVPLPAALWLMAAALGAFGYLKMRNG